MRQALYRMHALHDTRPVVTAADAGSAARSAAVDHVGTCLALAVIVKENYAPDGTLSATTVMYMSPGLNSDHNDWFWLKRLADGTVEASGEVDACILALMDDHDVNQLPVMSHGRFEGMISREQLRQAVRDRAERAEVS